MNVATTAAWPGILVKKNKSSARLQIAHDFASDPTIGLVHQICKALFISVIEKDSLQELTNLFQKRWRERRKEWNGKTDISLCGEMAELLTGCACEWAGIALSSTEIKKRAEDLVAAEDVDGGIGIRQLRSRFLRLRSEQWAQSLIRRVRTGELSPPPHSALQRIASYREPIFHLPLKASVAALELLNILRPLVTASRHMALSAQTIHNYPEYRINLSNEAGQEAFIQEVILKDTRYAGATLTPLIMKEFFKTWLSLNTQVHVPIPNFDYGDVAKDFEKDFKFNFKLEENRNYEIDLVYNDGRRA